MSKRQHLNFANEFDAITDIQRLRLGYTQDGNWSLAQICWHCWHLSKDVFVAPTAEQLAAGSSQQQAQAQGFIDSVNAAGVWPTAQQFQAPPGSEPPTDAGDRAIDDFIALLRTMAAYPHRQIANPFFGLVDIAKFRRFLLIHAAHHLSHLSPTQVLRRTSPRYVDHDAMIADIAHLRKGYTQGGNWSLAQICWHINLGVANPPFRVVDAQTPLTEAQTARQSRWDHYIAHGGPPAGFEAPNEMVPPATANDADIDALIGRLHALKTFHGKFIEAAAGVMPIDRARHFILAHGWRHLSCLHPIPRRREHLSFVSEAGVITDIKRLRQGYSAAGKWTLAQICWHLAASMPYPPKPGDPNAPLTEQQKQGQAFLDSLLANNGPPPGFQAPDRIVPPAECGEAAIDDLLRRLEALSTYNEPTIDMGHFGTVPTAKCRQMVLGHCARHLSFLRPIRAPREHLRFENEDAAIDDIKRLRAGYAQVGGWSLPQICWHLNETMQFRLRPGPHAANTPEQDARRPILERIMASGELPKGIIAPPAVSPPDDAGDAAIDACLATLEQFKTFQGQFAPHRLWGNMPNDLTRKQNLVHVAHHLSHLIPTVATTSTTPNQ